MVGSGILREEIYLRNIFFLLFCACVVGSSGCGARLNYSVSAEGRVKEAIVEALDSVHDPELAARKIIVTVYGGVDYRYFSIKSYCSHQALCFIDISWPFAAWLHPDELKVVVLHEMGHIRRMEMESSVRSLPDEIQADSFAAFHLPECGVSPWVSIELLQRLQLEEPDLETPERVARLEFILNAKKMIQESKNRQ